MASETVIQQRVISETNKAYETVRQARLAIERGQKKITSLRAQPASDWNQRQITEVVPKMIAEQECIIETAKARIEALRNGSLRSEIRQDIEESKREHEEQTEKSARQASKRAAKRNNLFRDSSFNPEQKQIFTQWKEGERQARREIGRSKGDLHRGEQYFWRVVNDFDTKNMAQNLKRMPNNRGYRYRGVDFYGELPPEIDETTGQPMPVVLTESSRGQQLIHEITPDAHKIFKKSKGRGGKRELISDTPRKRVGAASIMDFMVSGKKQRKHRC